MVGVERDLWSLDPFAGIRRGDYLYGRGALDFKGGLAAFAVAAMRVARSGAPLKRDIVLLSEADEEGGSYGTSWLAARAWAKLDAAFSLNEGGWFLDDARGRPRFLGISTVDKNSLSVRLETRGTSTHSSRPLPDSALARLTRALARIERHETTPTFSSTSLRHLRSFAATFGGAAGRDVNRLIEADTGAERRRLIARLEPTAYGPLLNGLSRTVYVPTIVGGGFRGNVLPGTAEATVNMRMLPGQRPRPTIRALRRVIGDPEVRVTPIAQPGASLESTLDAFDTRAALAPSRTDTELYRSVASRARRAWPGARVSPVLFEAGTDAYPWRSRGIPVYGIYPYPIGPEDLERMHATTSGCRCASSRRARTWSQPSARRGGALRPQTTSPAGVAGQDPRSVRELP